jgi:hypothetical protein
MAHPCSQTGRTIDVNGRCECTKCAGADSRQEVILQYVACTGHRSPHNGIVALPRPPHKPKLKKHKFKLSHETCSCICIRYLGLQLDSKLLFTKHLNDVTHKATGVLLAPFPLLARDSTLSLPNKLILYKLLIRPILTYAAPVWSNTSISNYRHLQIIQSKRLRVVGNYPRQTPIHLLHSTLNIEPLDEFIYRLSEKFFHKCSTHQNPFVQQIGDYNTVALQLRYKKYIHKRTKHVVL